MSHFIENGDPNMQDPNQQYTTTADLLITDLLAGITRWLAPFSDLL